MTRISNFALLFYHNYKSNKLLAVFFSKIDLSYFNFNKDGSEKEKLLLTFHYDLTFSHFFF